MKAGTLTTQLASLQKHPHCAHMLSGTKCRCVPYKPRHVLLFNMRSLSKCQRMGEEGEKGETGVNCHLFASLLATSQVRAEQREHPKIARDTFICLSWWPGVFKQGIILSAPDNALHSKGLVKSQCKLSVGTITVRCGNFHYKQSGWVCLSSLFTGPIPTGRIYWTSFSKLGHFHGEPAWNKERLTSNLLICILYKWLWSVLYEKNKQYLLGLLISVCPWYHSAPSFTPFPLCSYTSVGCTILNINHLFFWKSVQCI